jgi:hypothetical protein
MFDRIWKEQISQQKGKLGIWKPKEELKPREETEDDCCEKARDWFIRTRAEHYEETIEGYTTHINTEIKVYSCEEFLTRRRNWIANNAVVGAGFDIERELFSHSDWDYYYSHSREAIRIYEKCMGK